jgi:hypothetical protein
MPGAEQEATGSLRPTGLGGVSPDWLTQPQSDT